MTYIQVAQTAGPTDQSPPYFSRTYSPAPQVPAYGTVQATFVGSYNDGAARGCRITVQAENDNLIDPNKQYRITIEEVQP